MNYGGQYSVCLTPWEWTTQSGSHYSYTGGDTRSVVQHHLHGEDEIIMANVAQYWFPENVAGEFGRNFRPFFVSEDPYKGLCYFRSNYVTAYTSSIWENHGRQTWYVLQNNLWLEKDVASSTR